MFWDSQKKKGSQLLKYGSIESGSLLPISKPCQASLDSTKSGIQGSHDDVSACIVLIEM